MRWRHSVANSSNRLTTYARQRSVASRLMAKSSKEDETKTQESLTSKDYYFDSYSHFGIHEEMLKDTVRTRTYQQAIRGNAHQFEGKAVLDIGCGTGILSMFAAQAGARHVYAIDMSSIAQQAKEIVADNGFSEVITVMQGKMEELQLPEKVDIIISEWMGYALYYESMLPTVLHARDTWLKPGGLVLPDRCRVLCAGIEDEEYKQEKIEFWDNVWGFKMEPIKKLARSEPLVDNVSSDLVATSTATLVEIDIKTMTADDIPFVADFELKATRNDFLHAIVIWFDVLFGSSHKPLSFSTSPMVRGTHWKQAVFYFEDKLVVSKGEVLRGKLSCTPNKLNPRDLDFELAYTFEGTTGKRSATLQYRMR